MIGPEAEIARLYHILDAARAAREFAGTDKGEFDASKLRQSATIHQLLIIGEAAKHVSEETRHEWANIPWRKMARMRDVLIHHYFGADTLVVWRVAQEELPSLEAELPEMIAILEGRI